GGGFDLADAFGRNTVLGGQLVQGGPAFVLQPTRLDYAARTFIKAVKRIGQPRALQGIVSTALEHTRRFLLLVVGQIGDGRITVFVIVAFQGKLATGHAYFHLGYIFRTHIQFACNVVDLFGRQRLAVGTHAAQIEEQLALRLGGGNLDQTPIAHDVFVYFSLDPVHGKRYQPHTAIGVETFYCLHEADIAFLDQVGVRQPVTQILARDGNHQAQMRGD